MKSTGLLCVGMQISAVIIKAITGIITLLEEQNGRIEISLNNFKGIERYDYTEISQAIQGEASNGEKQLELYIGGKVENFALQSGDETEMRVLLTAINDQMGADAEYFDYSYYQSLKDTDRISALKAKAQVEDAPRSCNFAYIPLKCFSGKDISHIVNLSRLKKLFIESGLGIEDISYLADMAQLEVLILGETKKIYDYSCLGKLKNLKVLGVCRYQTNIGGAKLKMKSNKFINEMPNLEWVDLVDCKIG